MTTHSWYETLFDTEEWLDGVARRLPQSLTSQQVDFACERLALYMGVHVLDMPCGHGRHSLELARRGCRVTGVDLSRRSLAVAAAGAAREGLNVELIRADMRDVSLSCQFDAALNLFSSFGYLETVGDDQRVLDVVARALRPGGGFLIDVLNLHWLADHSREWHSFERHDGAPVLERRTFDPAERLSHATWTFADADGNRSEIVLTLRVYGPRELAAMLEQSGLVVQEMWGGFDGVPFSRRRSRLIVLARKPG